MFWFKKKEPIKEIHYVSNKEELEAFKKEILTQINQGLAEYTKSIQEATENLLQNAQEQLQTIISDLSVTERRSLHNTCKALIETAKAEVPTLQPSDNASIQEALGFIRRDLRTTTKNASEAYKRTYTINGKELPANKDLSLSAEMIPISNSSTDTRNISIKQYIDSIFDQLKKELKQTTKDFSAQVDATRNEVQPALTNMKDEVDFLARPKIKRKIIQKDFNELFDSVTNSVKKVK